MTKLRDLERDVIKTAEKLYEKQLIKCDGMTAAEYDFFLAVEALLEYKESK